ncbi:MAG TPA: hypothetical protein DCW90_14070 [Lachnospiraceae bacterium]|nr:hypothetical protein [Lachnospiraceae bacterium]
MTLNLMTSAIKKDISEYMDNEKEFNELCKTIGSLIQAVIPTISSNTPGKLEQLKKMIWDS